MGIRIVNGIKQIPFFVLERLFPFYIWIDSDYRIIKTGKSLQKVLPEAINGKNVNQLFDKDRSGVAAIDLKDPNFEENLYLLKTNNKDFLLRGQWVELPDKTYFLAASPWVHSPDKLSTLNLEVADFAVHDPILDLLNVIQSERMAKSEITSLVDKLSQQKTSLKKANQSLEEQNRTILQTQHELEKQATEAQKLAHVASRTDNSVVITNERGEIEWVNQSFEELTGFPLLEVKGKRPGEFLQGPETDKETVAYMGRCLKSQKAFNVELINYSKSGRKYWIRIEVQPIFNSKLKLTHYIAVESDITAQKQTEERLNVARIKAEQANKAMSEFLATVSHEIRTPMNGIIGMLEILMDTKLDREQKNYLSLIRVSSESLLKIINDVLDLSKIQSSRFELDLRPFELRKLTDEVVGLMSFAASKKDIDFEIIVHPKLYNNWVGDASRIRQVLINLVGNAIKFTEHGSVQVHINNVDNKEDGVQVISFEVKDTGKGIPPERLDDIFKPFTQIGRTNSHQQQGTGLGLSISKHLIGLMSGSISVTSEVDKGTCFNVELPLEPSAVNPHRPKSSAFGKTAITILPTPLEREVVNNHLKTKGMEYKSFENMEEGLHFLQETIQQKETAQYLLISEILLQGSNLEEIEKIVSKVRKHNKNFRVIILARSTTKSIDHKEYPFADNLIYRPMTYEASDGMHRSTGTRTDSSDTDFLSNDTPEQKKVFDNNIRLLLAEDHPINQEQLTLLLKRLGITPDLVRTGLEAVNAVKSKRYDVVLMDCQMPVMDGMEATQEIRKLNEKGLLKNNPHIIAITAFALHGDREKCLEAGMDAYISKPVYKKDVIDALEVALGAKQRRPTRPQADLSPSRQSPKDVESAFKILCSELSAEAALTLTQALIEMLPSKSQELDLLLEKNEKDAISRFGHSMKSICSMNGLPKLAELFSELEESAKELNNEDLDELVKITQREMKSAKKDLVDMVRSYSTSI